MVPRWSRDRAVVVASATCGALGLALVAAGIWLLVLLGGITSLRNENHYLFNKQIYWAQAAPWLAIVDGLIAMAAAPAGFVAWRWARRPLIAYSACSVVVVFVLLLTGALIVDKVNKQPTDHFVLESFYDAYHEMRGGGATAAQAFAKAERSLGCCGVTGARDYRGWATALPSSCCSDPYAACEFNDVHANERLGCMFVAAEGYKDACAYVGAGALVLGCLHLLGPLLVWLLPDATPVPTTEPPDDDD